MRYDSSILWPIATGFLMIAVYLAYVFFLR
jgi:hypothetical protein